MNERAVEKEGVWTLAGSGEKVEAEHVVITWGFSRAMRFSEGCLGTWGPAGGLFCRGLLYGAEEALYRLPNVNIV